MAGAGGGGVSLMVVRLVLTVKFYVTCAPIPNMLYTHAIPGFLSGLGT